MIVQLIQLRAYQIKRDLSYWIIIIAVAAFYISKSISDYSLVYGVGLTGVVISSLYNYHLNRKDINFINKYLQRPKLQICFNYNLLIFPITFAMCLSQLWYLALLLQIAVSIVSQTTIRFSNLKLRFISKYIPSQHFEWITGTRKNFYLLCVLLLIAIVLSPVKLFGLVALFMFNLVIVGFYNFSEPVMMLNPQNLIPEIFLSKKITFLSGVLFAFNAPLLIINVLFHQEIIWFNVCFLFGFLLLAASSVYIKYSNYKPNEPGRFSIDYLALIASLFIPYLLPLGILIYFSSRKKAIANLSYYSNDTN